jgi:hypothetical protein
MVKCWVWVTSLLWSVPDIVPCMHVGRRSTDRERTVVRGTVEDLNLDAMMGPQDPFATLVTIISSYRHHLIL